MALNLKWKWEKNEKKEEEISQLYYDEQAGKQARVSEWEREGISWAERSVQ